METRYFFKELGEQNAIYLSSGMPYRFEWLATSDAWLIQELDSAIQNGVGGVIRITKEQYEEGVKKKREGISPNNSPSYRQELQSPNLFNMSPRGFQAGRAVVAQAGRPTGVPVAQVELPDPLQVPDPSQFKMPSVGRMP